LTTDGRFDAKVKEKTKKKSVVAETAPHAKGGKRPTSPSKRPASPKKPSTPSKPDTPPKKSTTDESNPERALSAKSEAVSSKKVIVAAIESPEATHKANALHATNAVIAKRTKDYPNTIDAYRIRLYLYT
jgi:hypothetical protein